MGREDLEVMSELLYFGICFIVLAFTLIIRFVKGPTIADRAICADSIDILTDMGLILFALYTGEGEFLDIAMVTALLGFLGSTLISKYLEGKL